MNAFILSFCCLAVATTSGGVIKYIPLGSAGISTNGIILTGPAGSVLTNNALYSHGAVVQLSVSSEDLHTHNGEDWDHDEEGEWNEEEHGDGLVEKHNDWNSENEEDDVEEDKLWDDNEGQWTEDHNDWHKLVKRDLPGIKVNNGPEGRWNKEEERYEYNDSSNNQYNDEDRWINDKGGNAPIDSIPIWGHGHGW